LYDYAQRAHWIGGFGHNQLRHKPELDGGHSSYELHHRQLHRVEERNLDWNCNRYIVCRNRSFRIDLLQLHRGSDGRKRNVGPKFSRECDNISELMHDQTKCTNGTGCFRYNQLWHELELDCGHSSQRLHDQQLHRIAERNLDWNRNRHVVYSQRTCGFDLL
jgi:hypothetical protein